jgi:hypothetical protein
MIREKKKLQIKLNPAVRASRIQELRRKDDISKPSKHCVENCEGLMEPGIL